MRAIADVDHTFRFASTAPWYVASRPDQAQRRSGSVVRAGASSLRSSIRPTALSRALKPRISKPSAEFFLNWVDERIERIQKNVTDARPAKSGARATRKRAAVLDEHGRNSQCRPCSRTGRRIIVAESSARAQRLPMAANVESQPLLASINRLIEAMDYVGSPLPKSVVAELKKLSAADDSAAVTKTRASPARPACVLRAFPSKKAVHRW